MAFSKGFSRFIKLFLFLVFVFISGAIVLLEIPFFLAFGWIYYLYRVFPNIEFNIVPILEGIGAAIILTIAAHYFLAWLYKNYGRGDVELEGERLWSLRWTLMGVGLFILMFSTSISITGLVHQTGWLLRGPMIKTAQNFRPRATGTQMRIIGERLDAYYEEFKHFPLSARSVNLEDVGIPASYYDGPDKDAWGTPFKYKSDGSSYVLKSLGRNRVPGGEEGDFDDLVFSDGLFIVSPYYND
ncbi:MAG: type II secretion system protein GspG [Deltaproteobacteria bacterium]|nr:type II secretion system protein GspG [Deltaproteobacteria bacterium]